MRQTKKFIAILAFLLVTPTLSAKSEREKPAASAAASRVEYHGSVLGREAEDNFRVVIPGRLYRANILQPEVLSRYINRKGIKSIINALGKKPTHEWWQKESRICARQGVTLYNVPLHAHEFMPPELLAELLDIFDKMQGPLMVHCRSGVDRSGTVAGLWLFEKGGATPYQALKQLSFKRYGHFGVVHPQMRSFLKLWIALRSRYDREFALREYRAIYEDLNLRALRMKWLGNEVLKDGIKYVDQIRYNLDKGRYRPRSLTYKWRMKFQEQEQPAPQQPTRPAVQQRISTRI